MAFSPGKNVGRVSIRVVPDTKRFRAELRKQLELIERTTTMTVRVDKAKVDNVKVRESLRQQLAEFKDLDFAANVQVVVDSAKLRRGKLRASIQEQFDTLGDVRVYIRPEIHKKDAEEFQLSVDRIIRKASGKNVDVGMNAHTAAASAQMRYVTRPRFVDVFVRVNKASMGAALATLAALSGARLSYKWIDELAEKARNLDKTLPGILNWTSGITALIAALAGSVSGLVGIGQGLFSITPALLVLPGLFLNALGSLTVLIVALKNSRTELSALGDDMNELGSIINTEFWSRARAPIVDLVKGLMPQLRNAFRELSAGVGDFTAAMAQAFGQELAGGRLESIFKGIAEGWRILGTGASGFAGALVNLSEIAAKYTPRLATWFVRQANTFDNFLTSIATDGRLENWMEGAIDSMYDLWDATRGFAGVLSGVWRAANQAGSGGLAGFGEMMLEWRKIVNSSYFQTGLAAIFRGSYVAMDAFGKAIESVGRLIGDMPQQFERFVGSAGGFLGGLLDQAFQALNNVNVKIGLDGLSAGLDAALKGITPALQPIAETFGNFIGLLGDLAENLLPTAVGVLADLMPAVDGIIKAVGDVLPGLTDTIDRFSDVMGPAIEDLVTALSPVATRVFETLASVLDNIGPDLARLVSDVGPLLADALNAAVDILGPILDKIDLSPAATAVEGISRFGDLTDLDKIGEFMREVQENGGFAGEAAKSAEALGKALGGIITPLWDLGVGIGQAMADVAAAVSGAAWQIIAGLVLGLETAFPGVMAWFYDMSTRITGAFVSAGQWLLASGQSIIDGFFLGVNVGWAVVSAWFSGMGPRISGAVGSFGNLLYGAGQSILDGFLRGLRSAFENVKSFVSGIGPWIAANKGPLAYDRQLLVPAGRSIMSGFNEGLRNGFTDVQRNIRGMNVDIAGAFGSDGSPLAGLGNTINVNQPLLPGETPQEQRNNLVKELRWAV